jgi:hypothetical protein
MIVTIIIILVIALIVLPILSAFLCFPIGVYANIFGDQHKYSLRDYKKDIERDDDPLLKGCQNSQLTRTYATINALDGTQLLGEVIDNNSDKTLICLHGYRSNPQRDFAVVCQTFLDKGYNVLLIHQRAHGLSGGKHCTGGLKEQYDIGCWLDWCKTHSFGREYVLYGISMGGATIGYATEHLKDESISACIIDCAYSSICEQMNELSAAKVPAWVRKFVIGGLGLLTKTFLKVDVKKTVCQSLQHNTIPTAFLGGTADVTVSTKVVKNNFEANGGKKILLIAEGATHARAFRNDEIRKKLFDFLNECQLEKK